jgi:hypothetical protein
VLVLFILERFVIIALVAKRLVDVALVVVLLVTVSPAIVARLESILDAVIFIELRFAILPEAETRSAIVA